jgi:hypothetical protein
MNAAITLSDETYTATLSSQVAEKMWNGYSKLMVLHTSRRVRIQLYVFIGLIVLNGVMLLATGWGFTLGVLFFAPPIFASLMFLQYRMTRRKGKEIKQWLQHDPPENMELTYSWNNSEIGWTKDGESTVFLWADCGKAEEFEEILYVFGESKKLLFMLPKSILGRHYQTLKGKLIV